ncbi:triose-phosphate transporter family-domain-containing protein [Calycina marina]|uniref:Triose-phosphate transporter family-domain-containing protein n=1 Tax=Calycina marina TaxID=1763456 RepID=A0A9P7ZB30_9HELO|nr:triose-phosphate transporter family-domain-containing protein [Calycina marina]
MNEPRQDPVSFPPSSFQLDTSSLFPQTSLPRSGSIRSDEELESPHAAAALADINPTQNMVPEGSGHRRRKSSLLGSIVTDVQASAKRSRTKSPPTGGNSSSIQEESKPGDGGDTSSNDRLELEDLSEEDGLQDDEETGLTGKNRAKRKRRKRRNTLLDHRIAGEAQVTAEEKKEADQNVLKRSLVNALLIGLWYIFSLSISIYNKWMFDPKHLDFHFPLFTTCAHMFVQFSLSSLVLLLLPHYRPRYDSISNPHNTHADGELMQHEEDSKKPLMTKTFYFTRIGPCGTATGLDIGLGNMSLKFISLTFYTMCKSSALAFVLLFAFIFRLETPSWRLIGIIATMIVGVVMMVAGEVDFSVLGFVLVISAAFFSGFRWGLTQILLLRNPATSNPFSSIFYLAPIMFFSLLVLAIPVEGFHALGEGIHVLIQKKGVFLGPLLLLFPGAIAFCMTASEFALLQRTSVVTLSIAGIFKEVVTISAAGLVFGDPLTPVNVSGLFVTIGAIAAYNWIKIRKMRADALEESHKSHIRVEDTDHSEDDADVESGENEDWNTLDRSYVTRDGDTTPRPNYTALKTGEHAAPVDPWRNGLLEAGADRHENGV